MDNIISHATFRDGTGKPYRVYKGVFYHSDTPDGVVKAIDYAREWRERVRIYLGNSQTGEDWMEETDCQGYIGLSTGPVRVPLILQSPRSTGGPAILTHCIVRFCSGKFCTYQHPRFHQKNIAIKPDGFKIVTVNGKIHARFSTEKEAAAWVEKMKVKY